MALPRTPVVGTLLAFAARLRFPTLFFVMAALFVADLIVPDAIPLADELLLGLLTLFLSRWRKREPATPDV